MRATGWISMLVLLGAAHASSGCKSQCGDPECNFNLVDWSVVQSLSPLPDVPNDTSNKYANNDAAAKLGQRLFFDHRYSGPIQVPKAGSNGGYPIPDTRTPTTSAGQVGCTSCHDPGRFFVDSRSNPNNMSLGSAYTKRNAPSLLNIAYYQWHGWAGKQDSLWYQGAIAPETPTDANGDRCNVAHLLYDYYREDYDSIFETRLPDSLSSAAPFPKSGCRPKANPTDPDGPWEKMAAADKNTILEIMANFGKAMAAYETKLVSKNAAFDQYVAGDMTAISGDAKNGLKLFIGKAACVDCHNTPFFSDQSFHNLGVPQTGDNTPATDLGRFGDVPTLLTNPFNAESKFSDDPNAAHKLDGITEDETDTGKFKTATLRGISWTPPYMHTGGFATLWDVVEFYNGGGFWGKGLGGYSGDKDPRIQPLNLTAEEIGYIVTFLDTLNGDLPSMELRQPLPN
jgi:cytochrome c peroxidase